MKNFKLKRQITLGFLLCTYAVIYAVAPSNYYDSAEGKQQQQLKTALSQIIDNHSDQGYNGLYRIYEDSDDKNGKVWDMYSNCTWYHGNRKCGSYSSVCDCYNREHIIPQSWFDERSPMRSDAHHVVPSDGMVNGLRSSYPHGETRANRIGGNALGKVGASSIAGYTGTVYEPDDEYKGDIARIYFYFVTRYENNMSSFNGAVFQKNTYPSLNTWFYNLMLQWHRNDPVSQKEKDRNEGVYKYQHNRNPFIDYPELAEYIWGNKKNLAWHKDGSSIEPPGGTDDLEEEEEEEDKKEMFYIAKNPTNESLIIESEEDILFLYKIFSIDKQLMSYQYARTGEPIDVSNFDNGLYIILIEIENFHKTLKFIVAK